MHECTWHFLKEGCHELNYAVIPGLKLPEVQKPQEEKYHYYIRS